MEPGKSEREQQRRDGALREEDENDGLGPKSNADEVTMADAGLTRGGAATMTPATSGTETVPSQDQRVGDDQDNDEVGE